MTKRKIEYWVIPPEQDAEFVACMEEVLETYTQAYDPQHPVWLWFVSYRGFLPTFGEADALPLAVPAPPLRLPRGAHVRARVVGRAGSSG